jgi:hypothetical protein
MSSRFCSALFLLLAAGACTPAAGTSGSSAIPPIRIAATTGRADHVVAVGGTPVGAQGTTLGFAFNVALRPSIEVYGRSAGGSLTATASRENHDLAEVEAGVSVLVLPWLAATISGEGRSYAGVLATQRWMALRTGAEARMDLASGARGIIRASAFPKVTVEGLESPNVAVGGATGVELRRSRLFASLLYSIDRFDFPSGTGGKRVEQLSSLVLQAGWRFGR